MSSPTISLNPTYSRKAIASFLLGVLAIASGLSALVLDIPELMVVMLASTVPSIVLGVLARRQIRRRKGELRGSAVSAWGMWLGVVGMLFVLLLPAT
jgi:hypothetical protein